MQNVFLTVLRWPLIIARLALNSSRLGSAVSLHYAAGQAAGRVYTTTIAHRPSSGAAFDVHDTPDGPTR